MEIEYQNIYEQLQDLQDINDERMETTGQPSNIKTIWLNQSEWDYMFPGSNEYRNENDQAQPHFYMNFELRLKK
jgi:hypothetical protein